MRVLPELGEIRRRRRALDLTQAELAKQTRLSRSLIAKIEIGRALPSYEKAKKIFRHPREGGEGDEASPSVCRPRTDMFKVCRVRGRQ